MADIIIVLILITLGALALRSCLRKKKAGSCPGGCSGCSGNCNKHNK